MLRKAFVPVLVVSTALLTTACFDSGGAPGSIGDKGDVFGWDDRRELHNFREGSIERQLAAATAAMFFDQPFEENQDGSGFVPKSPPRSLGAKRGLCDDEPFVEQPSINACTAFLVGEDLVATAGHCVKGRICGDLSFAFDYGYFSEEEVGLVPAIARNNYYQCADIIERHEVSCEDDWALIRLDRAVPDREPMQYRRKDAPEVDAPLFAAGFPLSIPMKIAGSARIREIDDLKLHTDLDIFGGNSGSPVIDARTGVVEGIHVCSEAGNTMRDPEGRSCNVSLDCGFDGELCERWAEATRITRLSDVIDKARGIAPEPQPNPEPDAGTGESDAGPLPDAGF